MMRTHTCGELREEHIGERVTLTGWVRFSRDHGGVLFFDLADSYGTTQAVLDPENSEGGEDLDELYDLLDSVGRESVVQVSGTVRERIEGTVDDRNPTGRIEVLIHWAEVLNTSRSPPFELAEQKNSLLPGENLRMKFRYLDLRRRKMNDNLRFRHQMISSARSYLDGENFIAVETPMLTRSTPEGARDFIVPSRTIPGSFYALPQSPQLYKQMLMVGGVDRYYQIARCFRDEDARADRQPEFTQLDLEMAFVEEEDILNTIEEMLSHMWSSLFGEDLETPFPRITYDEAMTKFGTDSPDIRFGMELNDVTSIVEDAPYEIFQRVTEDGGCVVCLNLKADYVSDSPQNLGRNEIDRLIEWVKSEGLGGMTWMRVTEDGLASNIVKYFPQKTQEKLLSKMEAEEDDLLLYLAGPPSRTLETGSALREKLATDLELVDPEDHQFVWVVDCPLFEVDPVSGELDPLHHPFVRPIGDAFNAEDPSSMRGRSYDLCLDGVEIGSGSIRNHDPELQRRIFKAMNMEQEDIEQEFGFFLEALEYGAPPHGGIALGLDRLTALLLGCDNIREVIAFPKNKRFQSPMDRSPTRVEESKLAELQLLSLAEEEE